LPARFRFGTSTVTDGGENVSQSLQNRHRISRQLSERGIQAFFFIMSLISIVIVALIFLFLFKEGIPILKSVSMHDFLFGKLWYPTDDPPEFGIWPMIVGSLSVTFFASAFAIPIGILSAVYVSEIAKHKVKEIIKPVIELLASIPSVVIGFFGMVVVAPFLQDTFNLPVGLNVFNASMMLALMAIPTISSISEDALNSVPRSLREASFALGANTWETITRVVIPAGLSGISTAVILGMARAIGETMVVLMVAGGAAAIPQSIFDSCRPLPASIAAEMAEAPYQSDHYHALFATGIVLLMITFVFNAAADYLSNKYKMTEN